MANDATDPDPGQAGPQDRALSDAHVAYLAARAVSVDVARAEGWHSATAAAAAAALGRAQPLTSAGLVMPYPSVEPPYVRVRLDDGDTRYLAPAGREVPLYVPRGVVDSDAPLIVVESPAKALALVSAGLRAVGLGGTGTTLTSGLDKQLNASWDVLPLASQPVFVLFDSNLRTNANVARDLARLCVALERHGVSIFVAVLPHADNGSSWGPDDYLAVTGLANLLNVLWNARVADPVAAFEALAGLAGKDQRRALAALLDDLALLTAILVRGSAAVFAAREALRALRAVKVFDDALAAVEQRLAREQRERAAQNGAFHALPQYGESGGQICRIVMTEDGPSYVPLANFTARIERDIALDDGAEEHRQFEVSGTLITGQPLASVSVTASDFASEPWPLIKWGARAIVSAERGALHHLRAGIQCLSKPEAVRAFGHTGWVRSNGRWIYLHSDGAVGTDDAAVMLHGPLVRYRLPRAIEDAAAAVRTSLRLLDVASDQITVPLFCAVYRAPLVEISYADLVLWLWGKSGSLKSTLAALAMAHFGDFERERLVGNWSDTYASTEGRLFVAKDALAAIDDFAPRMAEDFDEMRRKAAQVIRAVGNGASRGRMRADLTARPDRPPRGLVVGTGEDQPSGESVQARVFAVGIRRVDVALPIVSELQRNAALLPHAMFAYVTWLAPRLDTLRTTLPRRFVALRDQFARAGSHLRSPAAAAHLALGAEVFCDFATDMKILESSRAAELRDRICTTLAEHLEGETATATQRTPERRFLDWLASLLTQGRVTLERDATKPLQPIAGEIPIGWQRDDVALLLAEPAFREVVSAMRSAGESVPVVASTLWGRLADIGAITRGDSGHHTVKRDVGGKTQRVTELRLAALDDADAAAGSPAPPSIPDGPAPGGERRTGINAAPSGGSGGPLPDLPGSLRGTSSSCSRNAQSSGDDVTPPRTPRVWASPPAGGGESGEPGATAPATPLGLASARYERVRSAADLPAVAAAVAAAGEVAIDTETTGLDPLTDRVRLVQLALPDGRIFVVDLFATLSLGPLGSALSASAWTGHNLHFDLGMLDQQFGVAPTSLFDTMLASQILDAGTNLNTKGYHALAGVCRRFLGLELLKHEQGSDWSGRLTEEQLAYAARDVEHLFELRRVLRDRLAKGDPA